MERRSEHNAQLNIGCAYESLARAGDQLATHIERVSSKNPISRWFSQEQDGKRTDALKSHFSYAAGKFESVTLWAEHLESVKCLRLSQFYEPSGHGVQWHMNQIEGDFNGQPLRVYFLISTDWDETGKYREKRWSRIKGYRGDDELPEEEAKELYESLIITLDKRNEKDGIQPRSFPAHQDHSEYFERMSAPKKAA